MRIEQTFNNIADRHSQTSQAGFTLMEVLIAISILAVGLLAIASMQIAAIQTTGGAKSISKGVMWAEDRMEMLSTLDWTDALLASGATINDPNPPENFTITWTVVDNNPRTDCKFITITVEWTERGLNKSTTLTGVKPRL